MQNPLRLHLLWTRVRIVRKGSHEMLHGQTQMSIPTQYQWVCTTLWIDTAGTRAALMQALSNRDKERQTYYTLPQLTQRPSSRIPPPVLAWHFLLKVFSQKNKSKSGNARISRTQQEFLLNTWTGVGKADAQKLTCSVFLSGGVWKIFFALFISEPSVVPPKPPPLTWNKLNVHTWNALWTKKGSFLCQRCLFEPSCMSKKARRKKNEIHQTS